MDLTVASGGGLYSSLHDLSALSARTLDYSILGCPEETRKWLNPHSMTSSVSNIVSQPWEIQRTDNLVPENPHTVDIYAKSGGAEGYVSQLSLVDQYGVGFVVLTAGPREAAAASILNDALIASFIPVIDKETRIQAQKYTGNFSSTASLGSNVRLELSMDEGTGLKIDFLARNGSDILAGIQNLWDFMIPQTGILNTDFRIYPADIEHHADQEGHVYFEDWLVNFDIIPSDNSAMSDLPGQGKVSSRVCSSWQTKGWLYYGSESLDRLVFKVNRTAGEVTGVEVPFLRSGLLEKSWSV